MGTPTTATASLVSLVPRSTSLCCGPPPAAGRLIYASVFLADSRLDEGIEASGLEQVFDADARTKASPLREGDRSGASSKANCFGTREAVAMVGVPFLPLFHRYA